LSVYEDLSDFKRLLFHHFLDLIEREQKTKAFKERFPDFSRVDALRICTQLADIKNEVTSPNDCLIASDEMLYDCDNSDADRPKLNRLT
jgi:hypothetical protein